MVIELRNKDRKKPQPLSKQVMYLTTSAILFGNISLGCSLTSFAPALDNMATKYKTTIEDISIVFTLMTVLYCGGTISCGFLSKYINRQFIAIISLCGVASSMFMTPYCHTKMQFFIFGGILGFSSGFYASSEIVWIIEIWQQKAGPFIQAQHFFFSLGTIIPSLVLAPFLVKNDVSQENASESSPVQQSIHIPFLIIGTLSSLSLMFQMFLFIFYRYHTPPMYANENLEPIDDAENIQSLVETDVSENISQKQNATLVVREESATLP